MLTLSTACGFLVRPVTRQPSARQSARCPALLAVDGSLLAVDGSLLAGVSVVGAAAAAAAGAALAVADGATAEASASYWSSPDVPMPAASHFPASAAAAYFSAPGEASASYWSLAPLEQATSLATASTGDPMHSAGAAMLTGATLVALTASQSSPATLAEAVAEVQLQDEWLCLLGESSAVGKCGPASFDSTEDGVVCIEDTSDGKLRWHCR